MSKMLYAFLLLFIVQHRVQAQQAPNNDALALKIPQTSTYTSADIAAYIKQNFTSDTARIRAIYVWITNNINYDIARLRVRNTPSETAPQSVSDVLKTRNAVCQGYADLFTELCTIMGIKASFVGGYTRINGVVMPIPHAWVAAELGGSWYLFDPTWGAGHVRNNQFVKSFTNRFYKVLPVEMIKDHMPFDPMYQFLNHPVSNKEFIDGQTTINPAKPFFNYTDTLKQFALLSPAEKLNSEARRLEANGVRNDLILDRLNYLKKGSEPFAFNDANTALSQATALFNQYIGHKNKQFATLEDKDLKQMMDSVSIYANNARTSLQKVAPRDEAQKQVVGSMYQHLEKFQLRIIKEKEFVTTYLATDKSSRRQLFSGR